MKGVNSASYRAGLPATAIFHVRPDRPLSPRISNGDEVILAAVTHPPRTCETKPISALLADVLARYGLANADSVASIDLLA